MKSTFTGTDAEYQDYLKGLYPGKKIHTGPVPDGLNIRKNQADQLVNLLEELRLKSAAKRKKFFAPDTRSIESYVRDTQALRNEFKSMLGWPLTGYEPSGFEPIAKENSLAEDDLSKIFQLSIEVLPGLSCEGILMVPHRPGPHPLAFVFHGGQGIPELPSGLMPYGNYGNIGRRVLERGFAVFCPQLFVWSAWDQGFDPKIERQKMDASLKQMGSSITAVELFKISRALDYFEQRSDIDATNACTFGLSYGGFYALFTAATDPRIKAAASSCYLNDRFTIDWSDWTWFDSGNRFIDAEVAALVCPRPLYIEVGQTDELFDVALARKEAARITPFYRDLGIEANFQYREFPGGHEASADPDAIDFLENALKGEKSTDRISPIKSEALKHSL